MQLVLPLCLTEANNFYNVVYQVQNALDLFPDDFSLFSLLFCITVISSLFKAVRINQITSSAKKSASSVSPSDEKSLSFKQCLLTICKDDVVDQHIMD
jgi:hypothetical protein